MSCLEETEQEALVTYINYLQDKLESTEIAFVSLLTRYQKIKKQNTTTDELNDSDKFNTHALTKENIH